MFFLIVLAVHAMHTAEWELGWIHLRVLDDKRNNDNVHSSNFLQQRDMIRFETLGISKLQNEDASSLTTASHPSHI